MKTSLVAILVTALADGLVDATPASNLNKRRVEKKRDAQKTHQAAKSPSAAPAPSSAESRKPVTDPSQEPSAAAARPAPAASPPSRVQSHAQAPAAAASRAAPAQTSALSREGKPPSRRFFSRLRSDASRNQSKAAKLAKQDAPPAAKTGEEKNLIYRRSWGPRAHRRPR